MATIGDTGAPSTNTVYYDALLSTTLTAMTTTIADNIFKDSAFLSALREFGGVKMQNGGERIGMPLMHGRNSTIRSYSKFGQLDTTPQEGVTTAFYEWREIGGTISISRKEERQNSGEAAILDLLQTKIKQAESSMREELNSQLILGSVSSATFVPEVGSNGASGLNPLGWFFRKLSGTDPVAGGNVGNISAAATNDEGNTFWLHQTGAADGGGDAGTDVSLSVTTYAGMKVIVRRMYNLCSKGSGGAPNLLLGDQVSYETYENSLEGQVRFATTKLGELGFDSVKVRGAEFIWDEVVPDVDTGTAAITKGTIFYLNTNNYKLVIDSETDIVTTPFIEPENQTAKSAKILFMGNAACNSLRKNGVLFGISQSIVA